MKKNTHKIDFDNMVFFDKEEKELYEALERSTDKPVRNWKAIVKRHAAYARYTLAKNKSVTFRVNAWDIERLKARAAQEGIPYQTLLSSLVHKYVSK